MWKCLLIFDPTILKKVGIIFAAIYFDAFTQTMISNLAKPIFLLLLLSGYQTPIFSQNRKELEFKDKAYEDEIKTILLYPYFGNNNDYNLPATVSKKDQRLVLEFDDLRYDVDRYYGRLVHCNQDWTKSNLADLDFLPEYNEFAINNFEYSIDTHIPYVHYNVKIPSVKLSGNYMVVIYRDGNRDDIVLSRRFMVYENLVQFKPMGNLVSGGSVALINQQINFTLTYKNLALINPLQTLNVTIRQNQRWDNMATEIKPSFPREFEHELEYRYYDDSKMIKGWNEFRFFDLRSLQYPGMNVERMNKNAKPFDAYIVTDKSKNRELYSIYQDNNGGFVLDNLDYNTPLTSNYVFINFRLQAPNQSLNKVYIKGAFNYWNQQESSEMKYDATNKEYTKRVLLKQGRYDYSYWVESKAQPPYFLEGSHFQTRNDYEIFVYYRSVQPQVDLLIGYTRIMDTGN